MDKGRLTKLIQTALDTSYEGVKISEINYVSKKKYDGKLNEWVDDSFSIFLTLIRPINEYPSGVEQFLESLLGFECCVDFC